MKLALVIAASVIGLAMLPAHALAQDFAVDVSNLGLATISSHPGPVTVGDKDIVVVANVRNNQDVTVNATAVIQVVDQYGFTEFIGFQKGVVAAHGEAGFGLRWVPQKPGKFVMDAFVIDDGLHILSDKSSSLVEVESGRANVKIPYPYDGVGNFQPVVAVVTAGYNSTVIWSNADNRPRDIIADKADTDFSRATTDRGSIQPDGFFSYTFIEPGRYGYHGNGFHGTVIVLSDPYQDYKKVRDSRIGSIDLDVYGSFDPTLAGHFAKGHVYDGLGKPLANSTITISANGAYMGNTTSDIDGCFDFQSFDAKPFSNERESATHEGRIRVDLTVAVEYAGDKNHFRSSATEPSMMYFNWPPVAPAEYEASVAASSHYNATTGRVTIAQGEAIEAKLVVKPVLKQYEVDNMPLELQRLPCGVSATISGHDNVSLDHAGNFQLTIDAKEYAKPGVYFILVKQDLSQVKNPYVHEPGVTGFWLEITPRPPL